MWRTVPFYSGTVKNSNGPYKPREDLQALAAGNAPSTGGLEGELRNYNSEDPYGARNDFRTQGGRKLFQYMGAGRIEAEL